MSIEVRVPLLPESITDGTLVKWKKESGVIVKQGENLVDLETDKVVIEIPAPISGRLKTILKPEGTVVLTGEVIAIIEALEDPLSENTSLLSDNKKLESSKFEQLSPSVRHLVEEHHLDITKISGTGKHGHITKLDVIKFIESQQVQTTSCNTTTLNITSNNEINTTDTVFSEKSPKNFENRVPMTQLRTRIAERLMLAKETTAMLTTFNEINMQHVVQLRNKYCSKFEQKHGIRLGIMSFFVKAVVEALKCYPIVNAFIDNSDIIYHNYYDIGIAVASQRGLVVPILRNAENMSIADIEKSIRDFTKKAELGHLTVSEITGGTFTITNGGVFGSLMSTPILNPPQSGILGIHVLKERPIVEDNQIVIRPMMYVAHTYDHRLIDGSDAVGFLIAVKEYIEDPVRIMFQV